MTTNTERYHRRQRIATGGMGEVWLAEDDVLNRTVAVKYLKREFADHRESHDRFLNEARTAASLHHPGIATVFDFGESQAEDGLPYLVMEYVPGRPLSDILDAGPLDVSESRDIALQAATALAAAHARGLVHRDVKPGNLIVTDEGVVKITDFGIARAADGAQLTATGQVIGTPSYLSPEQAEGRSATPASDVYALGVVLFECLTGAAPFVAENPVAVAVAHIREPVPDLPPTVPDDLAEVVRTALAKDPAQRYPDAGAFAEALAATVPAPADSTQVLDRSFIAHEIEGPERDRRLLIAGIALLVLLLVAAAVVGATSGGDGRRSGDGPRPGPTALASKTPTQAPAKVTVRAANYLGKPTATVKALLVRLGVRPVVGAPVPNPGGRTAGTVASIEPDGAVTTGATVTIRSWGPVPEPPKKRKHDGHDKGHD